MLQAQAISAPPAPLRGRPGAARGRTYKLEVLTPDEITAIMAATNKGSTGIRNRAFIAVLYGAGLRVSEALALRPQHIDLDAATVRVLYAKSSRYHREEERTIGLNAFAVLHVERWLARRKALGIPPTRPIFCRLDGGPWRGEAAREMLKYAARKAGVEKRVNPHIFRHSCAYRLMMKGTPVPVIQKQLGHRRLTTTAHYLNHLAPSDVVAAVHAADLGMDAD